MKPYLIYIAIPAITLACFVGFKIHQATVTRQLFVDDLAFIHQTLLENHPGVYNELDPEFVPQLEAHYQETQEKLTTAQNNNKYMHIIQDFGRSLDDTHLKVSYNALQKISPPEAPDTTGITSLGNGIYWISLPTFMPNELQRAALDQVTTDLPALRTKAALVFDLRGNEGGNSAWGTDIVDALFGNTYAQQLRDYVKKDVFVDWRASKDNVEHLKTLINILKKDCGDTSPQAAWAQEIFEGMQRAYQRGEKYYKSDKKDAVAVLQPHNQSPVTATIIVVVDHACVSAALDFIDDLKAMNYPILLVGQTTKANSLYMDIRFVTLPSGKGEFFFPIKVFRNRARGHNVPYVPDVPYNGDINDTQAVQQFVNSLIQ